ncbi:MAG: DNA/RNA non-specific endonuclease [Gammaproteobacteria bacterium]
MKLTPGKFFAIVFWLFKLGRKDPLLPFTLLMLGAAWYGYEWRVARPAMAYLGVPEAQHWQEPRHWFRVLRNDDFMIGYSDLLGNPLWVEYKIRAIPADAPYYQRPQRFTRDWRTLNPVDHDDYLRSGYDRGHLAPNHVISRLYGRHAQLDTFLMSNISPQRPKLNQKLWQRLEQVEADHFTRLGKEVWVVAGPVFDGGTERLKSAWTVEIPDAFYKIYALPNASGAPKLLAFLMPQRVKGSEPLTRFVTSVDNIERLTGLDFFKDLDDDVENRLEAAADASAWQLQKVAKLPAKY